MLKVYINNIEVFVKPNTTIFDVCKTIGIEIPRFCYHERLSIAGNCRMCLVEVKKSPKPVVSCAMPVMNGMEIFTNTPLIKKARESVLEFLLINHPLDCPICDQGGECDLQEQTMKFGSDRSRFYNFKRGVEDKNLSPLIKTIMTRCIHCTRCVRFAAEIAGTGTLGTTTRGTSTEIGTYIETLFQSELSGNIIDLCPVGALTSKPYAFTARAWELKSVESIDISDGIGSNIRIDFKESEICRILPRLNDDINEEWISDKARFLYDSFKQQRLLQPYIKVLSNLVPTNWEYALATIFLELDRAKHSLNTIVGICGANADLETQLGFKRLLNLLGSENIGFERKFQINSDFSANFKLNSTLNGIESADLCLLLGTNTRYEGSLLNTRLRKSYIERKLEIFSIGAPIELTYPTKQLGLGNRTLLTIAKGIHPFCAVLKKAKNPLIIIGSSLLERNDYSNIQKVLTYTLSTYTVFKSFQPLNFLQNEANQVGALELGLTSINDSTIKAAKILYLVGVDHISSTKLLKLCANNCFIIFQGTNGSLLASQAHMLLPSSAFVENEGTYINTEGRSQKSAKVLPTPGAVQTDRQIFNALLHLLNKQNYFTYLNQALQIYIPTVNIIDNIGDSILMNIKLQDTKQQALSSGRYTSLIEDFYLTSTVTRASQIMGQCSNSLRQESTNF